MKRINGYSNYSVTKDGMVFSHKRNKYLTPYLRSKSFKYLSVGLVGDDKKQRLLSVHVLVLEAYKGKRPRGLVAAHLDSNRMNNNISNLEWVTHNVNMLHRKDSGRTARGEGAKKSNLTEKDVLYIRENYKRTGHKISNIRELVSMFGINQTNISAIVRRKTWSHI